MFAKQPKSTKTEAAAPVLWPAKSEKVTELEKLRDELKARLVGLSTDLAEAMNATGDLEKVAGMVGKLSGLKAIVEHRLARAETELRSAALAESEREVHYWHRRACEARMKFKVWKGQYFLETMDSIEVKRQGRSRGDIKKLVKDSCKHHKTGGPLHREYFESFQKFLESTKRHLAELTPGEKASWPVPGISDHVED